jgi:hypothetical protein
VRPIHPRGTSREHRDARQALADSITGHAAGRDPHQVARELEAIAGGASIEELIRLRKEDNRGTHLRERVSDDLE